MRLLTVVLALAVVQACSSSSPPLDDKPCRYAGKAWALGETFPDVDLCNTCTCTAHGTTCTTRACLPDADAPDADAPDAAATPDVATDVATADVATTDVATDAATTDLATDVANTDLVEASASDAGGACTLDDTYAFGQDGGLVEYVDESTLSPPAHYLLTRTPGFFVGGAPISMECAPALPACGARDAISLLDVTRALAHPDVVAAFAQTSPPVYGRDSRPLDGSIFAVRRGDGRTLYIGIDCFAGQADCVAVPRGLRTLADQLTALGRQMLAAPECAAFR
jgi:hypothetical protein